MKAVDAAVPELEYEPDSKSGARKGVWVRVPPAAPKLFIKEDIC